MWMWFKGSIFNGGEICLRVATCSTVALSRLLAELGECLLWSIPNPYGNMEISIPHSSETSQVITMKLCMFDHVRETNTSLVGIRPLGVAPRIREIYTYCDFFLPSLLPFIFLRTCTGQTDRDYFTHNGSKGAVWRKEKPSQQVFSLIWCFVVHFAPKPPKFRHQYRNPSQIKKAE